MRIGIGTKYPFAETGGCNGAAGSAWGCAGSMQRMQKSRVMVHDEADAKRRMIGWPVSSEIEMEFCHAAKWMICM